MDLPCDDITATIEDDVDVIEKAIPPDAGDDVVGVAHATGGLHLAFLAHRRALRHAVYVCALVPSPGKTLVDVMATEPDMYVEGGLTETYQVDDLGRSVFSEEQLIADFSVDCPLDEAKYYATLSRPQKLTTFMETHPPLPDVPSTYIVGRRDITLNPEWSRRVARDRLGAEVVELDTGHTPMLCEASAVADVLVATVS
jgi:pimeloyl-ACP methyl ester carboxylesterase